MKYGVFFVDASFSNKTKQGHFGFYELICNYKINRKLKEKYQNSKEAEKAAIIETIHIAFEKKYENVIIFNDNKFAVKAIKKLFYENLNYKHMFAYIQFVWIPRDFNKIADFLSKNYTTQNAINSNEDNTKALEEKINSLINIKGLK